MKADCLYRHPILPKRNWGFHCYDSTFCVCVREYGFYGHLNVNTFMPPVHFQQSLDAVSMYGFYGAYNCYGLVHQVSGVRIHYYRSPRVGYMSILDYKSQGRKKAVSVLHVKPPRCGKASRKPHAFSWVRAQAIGAATHDFTN